MVIIISHIRNLSPRMLVMVQVLNNSLEPDSFGTNVVVNMETKKSHSAP